MGPTLAIETSTSEEIPPEFEFWCSDSKSLLHHLAAAGARDATEDLVKILTHLNLTIAPLTRIVSSDEEPLESFMARDPAEWRRQVWEHERAAREAAWQTPAAMVTTLDALLEAMRDLPASVSRLTMSDDYYFNEGIFSQDLIDLREMLRWAQAQQIPFVRFVAV
jgi:hypothetical protein